jgi:hypothetical protein
MNLTEIINESDTYDNLKETTRTLLNSIKKFILEKNLNALFDLENSDDLIIKGRYLGRGFQIIGEVPIIANHLGKLRICTYIDLEEVLKGHQQTFYYQVEENGNITPPCTKENFAEFYLQSFVKSVKEQLSSLKKSNIIR